MTRRSWLMASEVWVHWVQTSQFPYSHTPTVNTTLLTLRHNHVHSAIPLPPLPSLLSPSPPQIRTPLPFLPPSLSIFPLPELPEQLPCIPPSASLRRHLSNTPAFSFACHYAHLLPRVPCRAMYRSIPSSSLSIAFPFQDPLVVCEEGLLGDFTGKRRNFTSMGVFSSLYSVAEAR